MDSQRIFVGNVVNEPELCFEDLYKRFSRFGECLDSEFERHGTFGFLNMRFADDRGLAKLKASMHRVKFHGNVLAVEGARPNWIERWAADHERAITLEPAAHAERLRRERMHERLKANIKMNWRDRRDTIYGRLRQVPRKRQQMRNATLRTLVGNTLKVLRCTRQKLWGYERNREYSDLTYKFTHGKWLNGHDHVVERLDYKHARLGAASRAATLSTTELHRDHDHENDSESDTDRKVTTQVLSSMLGDFDFDKPMILEEDVEDTSRTTSNTDYVRTESELANIPPSYSKDAGSEFAERASAEEEVEKEEIVTEKTSELEDKQQDAHEEFTPKFGETISNTETLRNIFNPDDDSEPKNFTLIEENDDINEEQNKPDSTLSEKIVFNTANVVCGRRERQLKHLFFPHYDSPFLQGQTQLAHVRVTEENNVMEKWEDEFWEHRGEWMKMMKAKRKDALKQIRKRKSKSDMKLLV